MDKRRKKIVAFRVDGSPVYLGETEPCRLACGATYSPSKQFVKSKQSEVAMSKLMVKSLNKKFAPNVIKVGDIITKVNGRSVSFPSDIRTVLTEFDNGGLNTYTVSVDIVRHGRPHKMRVHIKRSPKTKKFRLGLNFSDAKKVTEKKVMHDFTQAMRRAIGCKRVLGFTKAKDKGRVDGDIRVGDELRGIGSYYLGVSGLHSTNWKASTAIQNQYGHHKGNMVETTIHVIRDGKELSVPCVIHRGKNGKFLLGVRTEPKKIAAKVVDKLTPKPKVDIIDIVKKYQPCDIMKAEARNDSFKVIATGFSSSRRGGDVRVGDRIVGINNLYVSRTWPISRVLSSLQRDNLLSKTDEVIALHVLRDNKIVSMPFTIHKSPKSGSYRMGITTRKDTFVKKSSPAKPASNKPFPPAFTKPFLIKSFTGDYVGGSALKIGDQVVSVCGHYLRPNKSIASILKSRGQSVNRVVGLRDGKRFEAKVATKKNSKGNYVLGVSSKDAAPKKKEETMSLADNIAGFGIEHKPEKGSFLYAAGVKKGDKILRVCGTRIYNRREAERALSRGKGSVDVKVTRGSRIKNLSADYTPGMVSGFVDTDKLAADVKKVTPVVKPVDTKAIKEAVAVARDEAIKETKADLEAKAKAEAEKLAKANADAVEKAKAEAIAEAKAEAEKAKAETLNYFEAKAKDELDLVKALLDDRKHADAYREARNIRAKLERNNAEELAAAQDKVAAYLEANQKVRDAEAGNDGKPINYRRALAILTVGSSALVGLAALAYNFLPVIG